MSVLQITKSMIVLILSAVMGPQVRRRSGERASFARQSPSGTKRTFPVRRSMSLLGRKADITQIAPKANC
jgi:hypothetical protein